MDDNSVAKAERNARADRQEEEEVARLRKKGYVAFRLDREVDSFSAKDGRIWYCDCKFSDADVFYITDYDIAKGLDEAEKLASALNHLVPVGFRVEMHFPRTRQLNNRRYIEITEQDRGWTIKVTKTHRKITTIRVKKGGAEATIKEVVAPQARQVSAMELAFKNKWGK